MKFQIKNHFTSTVQFECELTAEMETANYSVQLGFAVRAAYKARADLAGANLADANLTGANLAGANLARADLAGANLAGANLAGAYLARADLADANLAGAYLARANLAGADLAGAYLAGANLAGANLAGADLARADLADANLAGAYLAGANLAGADLAGADLARADLAGAYLAGADLTGANLAGANLTRANLAGAKNVPAHEPPDPAEASMSQAERCAARAARFRDRFPDVPVVQALDAKILAALDSGAGNLDMSAWHKCETTHCRAGWAITLAGLKGADLEAQYGPEDAGRRIYLASTGRVPHFFANNEAALADIREQAALQVSP